MRSTLGGFGAATVVAAATVLVVSSNVGAAVISPPIDFDVAADYNGNFAELQNIANIGHNAVGQNIRYAPSGDNGTSAIRYDTNPGDAFAAPADFLTETLSARVNFSTIAAAANNSTPSFGFYTRVQGDTAVLALLNTGTTVANANGSTIRLRLFYNANLSSTGVGTSFYDTTFTSLSNTYSAGSDLTVELDQTDGAAPTFTFSVSDTDGLIATSAAQVLPVGGRPTFANAGSVGMRFNLPVALNNFITADDFSATTSVIPEPAAASMALGAMTLLTLRRRVG